MLAPKVLSRRQLRRGDTGKPSILCALHGCLRVKVVGLYGRHVLAHYYMKVTLPMYAGSSTRAVPLENLSC